MLTGKTVRSTTAVIVAYGDPAQLARCLAGLSDLDSVIVVDNGRCPQTRAVAERFGARYVDPARNLGFAAAVNLAIGMADADADILLMNPDAAVAPGAVDRLKAELVAPDVAAAAPYLEGFDGNCQRVAWPFPSPCGVWLDALGLGRFRRGPNFLVGAVLLLNRSALAQVGLFDERFFLYAEEADWQLRALRAGWSLRLVPEVTARHVGGGTSTDPWRREVLFHRSAAAFGRKWYGPLGWSVMWLGSIVGAAMRAMVHRDGRRGEAIRLLRLYLHLAPRRLSEST